MARIVTGQERWPLAGVNRNDERFSFDPQTLNPAFANCFSTSTTFLINSRNENFVAKTN